LGSQCVHLLHHLLLGLRLGQSGNFLLLSKLLLLQHLLFGFDDSGVLDPVQVLLADDNCVILIILFSFGPDVSQLVLGDEARARVHSLGCSAATWLGSWLLLFSEQCLVNI